MTSTTEQAGEAIQDAASALASGDYEHALRILQQARKTNPANAEISYLSARAYMALGYPEAAVQHFETGLAARKPQAVEWLDLIIALRLQGSSEQAIFMAQQLLDHHPHMAMAHVQLGNLRADTGNREAAAESFRAAIRLNKDCVEAWLSLILLGTDYALTISSDELNLLNQQVVEFDTQLDEHEKRRQSLLHFCVARLMHSKENFAAAFMHFENANRYRKLLTNTKHAFDIHRERDILNRMRSVCQQTSISKPPAIRQHHSVTPIFIVGMLRTGTTLLETLLGRHSRIVAGGEMMHLKRIAQDKLPQASGTSYPECLQRLNPSLCRLAANHYRQQALATAARMNPAVDVSKACYVVDKLPSNFQDLALIRHLFPEAIIIHTSRHPMDTIWSCFRENLSASYCNDLDDLVEYYLLYLDYMKLWQQLGIDIHHLAYEELVSNPETSLRNLLRACAINYEPLTANAQRATLTNTASAQQVRSPIHGKAIGQWRRYGKQLKAIQDKLNAVTGTDQANVYSQPDA